MFKRETMVTIILTVLGSLYILAFTHVGTAVYSKTGLGVLQAAVVANPPLMLTVFFATYLLFDRSAINGLIIFILVSTVVLTQYPTLTPTVKTPQNQPILTATSTNMLFSSGKVEADLANIMSYNPDIILLQEFNINNVSTEGLHMVQQKYPHFSHSTGTPKTFTGEILPYEYSDKEHRLGLTVFSKTPLNKIEANGRMHQTVTTTINGEKIVIINAHTVSPINKTRHDAWLDSFQQLDHTVTTVQNSHPEHVIVMGGDFNANNNHSPFRELIIDNNLYQNRNQTPTWGLKPGGVKLFKLDHILTNSEAHPTVVKKIATQGSDHDGIYTEIYSTKHLLNNDR